MIDIKPSTLNELSNISGSDIKSFDPDKRIDVSQKQEINGKNITYDADRRLENYDGKIEKVKCLNENLEGKRHPDTNVPFVRKVVETSGGEKVGVFPVFKSKLDVQLPNELLKESDFKQFKECNSNLKEAVSQKTSFRESFTDEQIDQIMDGDVPDGYVWHHGEEEGKMQLVDFETHDKTAHTGGKSVWGGGRECR